jgi:hypothetical protein
MNVSVPLGLREQLAMEEAIHEILDPYEDRGWRISLAPFNMIPGCLLEVAIGPDYVERCVLDAANAGELSKALQRMVRRPAARGPEAADCAGR